MARVVFEGKRLDDTTRDRLLHARKVSGLALVVTQGGYNAGGVAASAGTHDGGGVLDIRTRDLSLEDKKRAVLVLRQAGFVAWLRTVAQGFDIEHIHAVELASTTLSPAAQRQIDAWRKGRNGLASGRPDDGPRVDIPTAMPGTTKSEEDQMNDEQDRILKQARDGVGTVGAQVKALDKKVDEKLAALLGEIRSRDNKANAKEWARFGVLVEGIGKATEGLTLAINEVSDGPAKQRLEQLLVDLRALADSA